MKSILIAHDGSKSSEKALKIGMETALKFGSAVAVLSVVPELYLTELTDSARDGIYEALNEETRKMMEKVRKTFAGKSINSKTIIRQGNPAEVILDTAKKMKADLIIMGSHGRHGAKKFLLGSVSSKVVDHAQTAVLVAK